MASIEPGRLADFIPFSELEARLLQQLALKTSEKSVLPGETILRKKRDSPWVHYLLSGEIEVRTSFFERFKISHRDKQARLPLEDLASNEAQVTAVQECRVARISLADIELARQQNAASAFQAHSLDPSEVADNCVVEDTTLEADWLSEFLHSPLVNHVSARDIQQLLACIEDIDYQAGDEIVRNGQHGDFFYIVKSGLAIVHTDPQGPYKGKEFSLMPGGYFGEEALVGGAAGQLIGFIDPTDVAFAGPTFGVWMILMAILGGKGTLWGPVIGAVIFHITQELFWSLFFGWQRVALGAIIVAIVVFFPMGLMGWMRERWPERFGERVDKSRTVEASEGGGS